MPIYHLSGLGQTLLVQAEDEATARGLASRHDGKRDDRWLGHDHASIKEVKADRSTVLFAHGEPEPVKEEAKGKAAKS